MCGMHLASRQVDHHSAHWFAVTVRVNLAFAGCLHCKCGIYISASSLFSSDSGPVCVTILFVSNPWGCISSHISFSFFFLQMEWAHCCCCWYWILVFFLRVHWVLIKWLHCVVDVCGCDAEQVLMKTCLEQTLRIKLLRGWYERSSFVNLYPSSIHSFPSWRGTRFWFLYFSVSYLS